MGGWRDADGRTSNERRKRAQETARAEFADTVRRRPLSLLKGLIGFLLIAVLAVALIVALR